MSKPSTLSYERFTSAALSLEKDGQRVSVRAIRDKIGGANLKLMEFLRQWRAEKALASHTDEDISDAFHQSLLAEFGRVAQKTKIALEKKLADETAHTQEALDLLAETEKGAANLEEDIASLKQANEAATTAYDKNTAAIDARLSDSRAREKELSTKLEATLVKLHQSEIQAAVLKSRCDSLEKQLSTKDKKA